MTTPKRSAVRALLLLGAVALTVYVADQLSKAWVVETLPEGEPVEVLGTFLQFLFMRNPGAAFSLASGSTWIFSILAAVVTIVIVVLAKRIKSFAWAVVFGLLLAGTLGNLTDRLTRPGAGGEIVFGMGYVIDFIWTPWMMPAIYNIADIAIVTSMCLLVLLTLLGFKLDGTREERQAKTADGK